MTDSRDQEDDQGDGGSAVDEAFMREAVAEAEKAARDGDVPVGAVVVRRGHVIGWGRNRRQLSADPT
ncbi:MAG TPA: deaminase, partial [Candidatus Acidoferrum sp.]|nr:deaminase [Candidatus Acidoferrum sp.]